MSSLSEDALDKAEIDAQEKAELRAMMEEDGFAALKFEKMSAPIRIPVEAKIRANSWFNNQMRVLDYGCGPGAYGTNPHKPVQDSP